MESDYALEEKTRIIPEKVPLRFFAQHLKPYELVKLKAKGKTILEIGCGEGYGANFLSQEAEKVMGIDYDPLIIENARDKYKKDNLSFQNMEATDLKFSDNTFDIVCSFQVIEHIPEDNLLRYLSEVLRVLKLGGEFYLSTLNLEKTKKPHALYEKNPAHHKEFTLQELKGLLTKIFNHVEIYGLHLTARHRFYQRLKKIGIFNFLSDGIDPIKRYYNKISTEDFIISPNDLRKSLDLICICRKV